VFTNRVADGIKLIGSRLVESESKRKPEELAAVNVFIFAIKSLLELLSNGLHPLRVVFKRTDKRSEIAIPDADRLLFITVVDCLKLRNNIVDERLSV
jgi:hypothetical protein